jgi:hypothetical protein
VSATICVSLLLSASAVTLEPRLKPVPAVGAVVEELNARPEPDLDPDEDLGRRST